MTRERWQIGSTLKEVTETVMRGVCLTGQNVDRDPLRPYALFAMRNAITHERGPPKPNDKLQDTDQFQCTLSGLEISKRTVYSTSSIRSDNRTFLPASKPTKFFARPRP